MLPFALSKATQADQVTGQCSLSRHSAASVQLYREVTHCHCHQAEQGRAGECSAPRVWALLP